MAGPTYLTIWQVPYLSIMFPCPKVACTYTRMHRWMNKLKHNANGVGRDIKTIHLSVVSSIFKHTGKIQSLNKPAN